MVPWEPRWQMGFLRGQEVELNREMRGGKSPMLSQGKEGGNSPVLSHSNLGSPFEKTQVFKT